MENLKEKARTGISLGFLTKIGTYVSSFVLGLILARLLSPKDYGLIGMLAIFLSLSEVFIDSGFGTAVLRKKTPTSTDYSTVFWFNIILSISAYIILFIISRYIANFYGDDRLINLTKAIGLVVVVNAFGSIQGKYLNKNMQYKKLAKVYALAIVSSSVLAVLLAAFGLGVWTLVIRSIFWAIMLNAGWWFVSSWKPSMEFSWKSFKDLGGFGSKILATSLFNSIFSNIYSVIVGKLFNATNLGFFSRAKQFYDLPDDNIRSLSMNIFFPALSYIQDENSKLIKTYTKILGMYAFILFPLYCMLAIIAKPMIMVILTEKWIGSASLLQYFCLLAFALPFESVYENTLYIKGRADFIFFATVLRKSALVFFMFSFSMYGLKGMVWAFVLERYLGVLITAFFARKELTFSFLNQIKEILPSIGLSFISSIVMLIVLKTINVNVVQLILVPIVGLSVYLILSYFFKRSELKELIELSISFKKRLKEAE